jgi:aminomethyltransferase
MPELKKTPLYAMHCASAARIIDFSGWAMPLHYGSQLDEHRAVRTDAGMFDVSHMCVIDLLNAPEIENKSSDPDRVRRFLRYAVANNIDKLRTTGRAFYTCMLNAAGGVLDDLIIYYLDTNFFRLVVNAATAERDLAWLKQLNLDGHFGIMPTPRRDLALIAVQGPCACEKVARIFPTIQAALEAITPFGFIQALSSPYGEIMLARTGYTGEEGFELIVPAHTSAALWQRLQQAGVRACGLGARDTLRLEAGLNLYGQDMDEETSPLDAGLDWTVDLKSARDFIGRSALIRDGCRTDFVGLVLSEPKGVLRARQKVITALGEGIITSGTFSPTLQRSIALARIPRNIRTGDAVQVPVRDKMLIAHIVKPPFVRQGRILVN